MIQERKIQAWSIIAIGAIALAIFLSGCKTVQQVPIHDSTSVVSSETVTEDPTWTVPVEAYWNMVFECDSSYEVLLRDYEYLNLGFYDKVEIHEVVKWREDGTRIKQLSVNISALVDSIEVQNRTIEKLRSERVRVEVPVEVPGPEVVRNSRFANFALWFFWGVVVAGVGYTFLRFKKVL